jgi:hypothetical protein
MPIPRKQQRHCRKIRREQRRQQKGLSLPPLPNLPRFSSPPLRRSTRILHKAPLSHFQEQCDCFPVFTCENCMKRTGQIGSFPLVQFRRDDIEGEGIKAGAEIEAGSFIVEYTGRKSKKRIEGPYVIEIRKGRLWIDGARRGNLSKFINHSCDPNCTLHIEPSGLRAMIFAAKNIARGEKLTIRYSPSKEDLPFDCVCPKCCMI